VAWPDHPKGQVRLAAKEACSMRKMKAQMDTFKGLLAIQKAHACQRTNLSLSYLALFGTS